MIRFLIKLDFNAPLNKILLRQPKYSSFGIVIKKPKPIKSGDRVETSCSLTMDFLI